MSLPKEGTIERLVLDRMMDSKIGLSYIDFHDVGMSEEKLEEVINNLRHGIYEAEDDSNLKFDA